MHKLKLIGPFTQAVSMDGLPLRGALADGQLEIISQAGILVNGERIEAIGSFRELKSLTPVLEPVEGEKVVIPGLVDSHTHICWAGSRAGDYAMRLAGRTYLEIAQQGGGIWSTVTKTRDAGLDELAGLTTQRANRLLRMGTTTIEVKSGYGLNADAERKMLKAVQNANILSRADLVPTCLAAHIKPRDFDGTAREYLDYLIRELLPGIRTEQLSQRVDIYVDEGSFGTQDAFYYLTAAKELGFDVVVHADQFKTGGARLAVEVGALTADHLEASSDGEIQMLAESNVIPVALPGASLGLGVKFAPARNLLNAGTSLVIASDWNPGSAPMGNLLMQAAVLGVYEKLTMTETLAAITCRAAAALKANDRGMLKPGMLADFIAFPCGDYREILYNQGAMMPRLIWKRGVMIKD